MNPLHFITQKGSRGLALTALCCSMSYTASATVVFVETSMGNFEINLLDEQVPQTVANFLSYVENQSYDNAIVHRSVNGFITQTGGYTFSIDDQQPEAIPSLGVVVNEPVFSNVRGTIAMAKVGGDPNSATSQWFINLSDNSANLDTQNGGFTVFGVVIGDGMEVVDDIAQLPVVNAGGAFAPLPLRNMPAEDELPNENHLVLIESVTVTDPNVVTYPELTPPLSTAKPKSGGGSLGLWSLLLSLPLLGRRFLK